MNIIKTQTVRFIRVKAAHYLVLFVVILTIVLLVAAAVANTMQISILTSDLEAMQRKADTLQREQEINKALIEGQATQKTKLSTPADQSKVESSNELTPRGMLHIYYSMPLLTLQGGRL